MSTIKQIQSDFIKEIFNRNHSAFVSQIRPNPISSEFRLSIYRNSIVQTLCKSLEITFCSIWKLVGKACADSLAFAFIQDENNLPKTSCLEDWGGKFPEFLQGIEAINDLVYLKGMAELDWLKHLSYGAADYQTFNPLKLQNHLNNHSKEELYLFFNPTVFLYSSPYSLKDICGLIENPSEKNNIELRLTPCYVVIHRQYNQVLTHWISQELFVFFDYLKKGFTLTQAYEYVLKTNSDFDLSLAFALMFKNELLCG